MRECPASSSARTVRISSVRSNTRTALASVRCTGLMCPPVRDALALHHCRVERRSRECEPCERVPCDRATAEESMSHHTTHEIGVSAPFRLDLTVSALRRTSSNLVDVYTGDGRYLRALGGFVAPVVVSV